MRKRSPTSHRTPEQIKKHGRTYQASPEQKKNRAARNKARREAIKAGTVKKGDGKDMHHVKPMAKGGARDGKAVAQSASKNRGHGMSKNGNKPSAKTLAMRRRLSGK